MVVTAVAAVAKQKRRIYDIPNVLEGIGLIIKDSTNMIRWKGAEPDPDSAEFSERLAGIRTELIELEQEERNLDVQQAAIHEKLKDIINLPANAAASYVEWSGIASLECFKNDTVLGIRGPPQTQLLVPKLSSILKNKSLHTACIFRVEMDRSMRC